MSTHEEVVTYVTIPVRMVHAGDDTFKDLGIDLTDDGDPGPWGDTYVYDPEAEEGRWHHWSTANALAFDYVAKRLSADFISNRVDAKLIEELAEAYQTWVKYDQERPVMRVVRRILERWRA